MNEVFETVAEVLEELRSEAEEREYSVHTNESENADKALKKANREYETVLAELSAEHREFFENYMDIVDHAHFQEEQRAYYQGMVDAIITHVIENTKISYEAPVLEIKVWDLKQRLNIIDSWLDRLHS